MFWEVKPRKHCWVNVSNKRYIFCPVITWATGRPCVFSSQSKSYQTESQRCLQLAALGGEVHTEWILAGPCHGRHIWQTGAVVLNILQHTRHTLTRKNYPTLSVNRHPFEKHETQEWIFPFSFGFLEERTLSVLFLFIKTITYFPSYKWNRCSLQQM